jgi:hypothetical protein
MRKLNEFRSGSELTVNQTAGPGSLGPAAEADAERSADSREGTLMRRKSLVALMIGVMCAGSAMADDSAEKQSRPASTGLVGWFKNKTSGTKSHPESSASKSKAGSGSVRNKSSKTTTPPAGGIERAVVADAERQAVSVKQTAADPHDSTVYVHEMPFPPAATYLEPAVTEQAPATSGAASASGTQAFNATPVATQAPTLFYPQASGPVYSPANGSAPGYPAFQNASFPGAIQGAPCPPGGPGYSQSGSSQFNYSGATYARPAGGAYPQTGAALYPCPVPGIPIQIGGAAITNPALHPHEMLYAHRYKAMYPPYYYRVHGGWVVTPFGVWSKEDWHLQGTVVDVKYKSHISPFAHFKPPYHR